MSKKYFLIVFLACLQLQDSATILGEICLNEIYVNEDVPAQAFIPQAFESFSFQAHVTLHMVKSKG